MPSPRYSSMLGRVLHGTGVGQQLAASGFDPATGASVGRIVQISKSGLKLVVETRGKTVEASPAGDIPFKEGDFVIVIPFGGGATDYACIGWA